MKTKKSQNKGINMTTEDVRAKIAQKKEQHAKQQARKEKLEQTMQNTSQDIEQLEHTLAQLELAETSPTRRKPRFIPRDGISSFFSHASRVFDRLQHRLRRTLNYTWFCLVLCSRYVMESRCKNPRRRYLTPATVLGYFKREREE